MIFLIKLMKGREIIIVVEIGIYFYRINYLQL